MELFLREIAIKSRIQNKVQLSQKHYWENFKIPDDRFRILKILVFLTEINYLVKLLSNH